MKYDVVCSVTRSMQGRQGRSFDLECLAVDDRKERVRFGDLAPRILENLAAFLRRKSRSTLVSVKIGMVQITLVQIDEKTEYSLMAKKNGV